MEIEERAAEARNIINSPTMQAVFEELNAEYTEQLIQAEVGGLTASTAHASMKVLRGVQMRLQSYVTDQQIQSRGNFRR
jgi:ABC-type microcin C transport system duplicated ATPase subunit YejF